MCINVISTHDHTCICPVTTLVQVSILDILLRSSRKTTFEASSVAPNHRCSDGGAWFVDGQISFRGTIQTGKANIPWFTTGFILHIQTMAKWGFLNHQRYQPVGASSRDPTKSRLTKVTNFWITEKWLGPVATQILFSKKSSPQKLEKMSNFTHIFQMGWFNHQLDEDLFGSWDMLWKDGFQC